MIDVPAKQIIMHALLVVGFYAGLKGWIECKGRWFGMIPLVISIFCCDLLVRFE